VVPGFSHLRSDRSQLAPPIKATIYEGRVARTHAPGDALEYSTGPEHRDTDELANIVRQLPGLKIYLGHPDVYPAATSGQKVVGYVDTGRLDGDTAVARMVITDEETLAAIKAGTHELSLGYACGIDDKRYQRGIQLDHLAVVEMARCGAVCAMRTDMLAPLPKEETVKITTELEVVISDESRKLLETLASVKADCAETNADGANVEPVKSCTCNNHAISHNNGETMSDINEDKAKLDAALVEVAALKAKVTELEVAETNARNDAKAAQAKLDEALAAADKAKTDAEAAVAQAKTDAADAFTKALDAKVEARVNLLVEAKELLPADTDLSKLSDRAIKVAVIKHVDGDEISEDKVDAYVDGVYAGALKRGAKASTSREDARVAINNMRKDGVQVHTTAAEREKIAKENMHRESSTAWTKSSAE
jgi:hypothetical protein